MRKTKEQKAITLIALIITIVVLLILAVVAINAVTGDGIIQHATNAKTAYENAEAKEESILSYYEDYLVTEGKVGSWKKEESNLVNDKGEKIPIGAKVNYTPEKGKKYVSNKENSGYSIDQTFTTTDADLEWRIIGVEYGKILLMPLNGVVPDENDTTNGYRLSGTKGYKNGKTELDKICSIYGTGSYAESARSLTEEDIDKLFNIDEEYKEIETNKNLNGLVDYSAKYAYEYVNETITISKNGTSLGTLSQENIYFVDGDIVGKNGNVTKKEITSYYISIFGDEFKNKFNSSMLTYMDGKYSSSAVAFWTTSKAISIFNGDGGSVGLGDVCYGYKMLSYNSSNSIMYGATSVYDSRPTNTPGSGDTVRKICPVVTLDANVKLTLNNGVYDLSWN